MRCPCLQPQEDIANTHRLLDLLHQLCLVLLAQHGLLLLDDCLARVCFLVVTENAVKLALLDLRLHFLSLLLDRLLRLPCLLHLPERLLPPLFPLPLLLTFISLHRVLVPAVSLLEDRTLVILHLLQARALLVELGLGEPFLLRLSILLRLFAGVLLALVCRVCE